MHGTHCKHNMLVSSLVCIGTLGHIPRYMDRMSSNNNKMLIDNSLCCFTIRVIYTRITVTWDIRYIDEGFLVWIVPSMHLSHEAVNWACTTSFAYIRFYSVLSVLYCFLYLGDNSGYINSGYIKVRYSVYIYEGFLFWIIPSTYSSHGSVIWAYITDFATFTLLATLLSAHACMYSQHDFQYMIFDSDLLIHVCLSMHATWHSSCHSLGNSDSPGPACSDLGAWTVMDFLVIRVAQR